ncbi:MAG: OmpA family protein [Bacteroidetes bacterium]|nr:OmpA family protein [Bacteroidota bacterium]
MKKIFLALFTFVSFFASIKAQSKEQIKSADNYFKEFKYYEALDEYLEMVKDPAAARNYYVNKQIAECYRRIFDYENAEKWYSKLMVFKSDATPDIYYNYAQILVNNEKYADAKAIHQQYVEKSGKGPLVQKTFEEKCNWAIQHKDSVKEFNSFLTNLETGGRYMGMEFYNNGLIFASPLGNEFKMETVYYDIVFVPQKDSLTFNKKEYTFNKINEIYYDATPCLSKNGKTLYFSKNGSRYKKFSVNKADKAGVNKSGLSTLGIYSCKNKEGVWEELNVLNINSVQYDCAFPALSEDGKTLYFASNMPGGFGGFDLYKCQFLTDSTCTKPVNLGEGVNTAEDEIYPQVVKDKFYFASKGRIGFGGYDLYEGVLVGEDVKNIKNMGKPFNSSKDDISIVFHEKGNKGYFASNREGTHGYDRVYYFNQKIIIDTISGKVVDRITKKPITGVSIDVYEYVNGKPVFLKQIVTADDGSINFLSDPKKEYKFVFKKDGYQDREIFVPTADSKRKPSRKQVLAELESTGFDMTPVMKKNTVIRIDNIYFDYNKASLRSESYAILENLISVLQESTEVRVELSAHTDAAGGDAYNMKLSQARAQTCFDYLVGEGVDKSRLIPKGYGETKLLNNCKDATKCTEAENQINRRVEVKVL